MRDIESGLTEADITVNGRLLSFAESMAVRVAIGSFRLFCNDETSRKRLGLSLASGYDRHLQSVEQQILKVVR